MATYEMLWDCPFCGTRKLLGKTHRHCPNCGAPQDPSYRYFPSDAEKVAVEDHVFVGADRLCPACQNPMSAAAPCCSNCGSPMDGGSEVRRRADQFGRSFASETEADARRELSAPAAPTPPPVKKKKRLWLLGCLGCGGLVGAAGLVLLLVAIIWTEDVAVTVTGHSWTREIEIEEFSKKSESEWCDSMPSDAYDVTRTSEVRSTRRVPDGESCTTQRVDNGDGTFTEKQVCTTTYREEPVHDDRCHYTVDRWVHARSVKGTGGLDDEPAWPAVQLAKTGQSLGSERQGRRTERYVVHFVDQAGRQHECEFGQAEWAAYPPESTWKSQAGVLTGLLDCDALTR